ncbi:sodium/hydrogen exchanger 10-like isoform X9 [Bacillus rossius redtenbacheri]|uniref:sodium/hydrogen exchanger 10-like isoform X9 n=1 Tax=Bacillus rossius redtenbacheri TaxID=93214 RepID=UPI002FDD36C5
MKYLRTLIAFSIVKLSTALNDADIQVEIEYVSPRVLFALLLILATGSIVRLLFSRIPHMPCPLGLIALGFFYGWLTQNSDAAKMFTDVSDIHPRMLLLLFLPALNFRTAYTMDGYTFFRIFWQILLVGVPGFLISSVVTAFILMILFDNHYAWDWNASFLFGAITSTTFCHDVVTMLRNFDQSKPLVTLLEGEHLLGDATALGVFYYIISPRIRAAEGENWTFLTFVNQYWALGLLCGWIGGQLTFTLCQRFMTDATRKTIVILSVSYITFFVAEELIWSCGVLQVSLLGIFVGFLKTGFDEKMESTLKHTWESVCQFSETFVFVIIGISIMRNAVHKILLKDFLRALFTYIVCNTSRAVMYVVLLPVLQHIGYGFSFRDAIIAVLGSQYGILSILLSLMVKIQLGYESFGLGYTIDITVMMMLKFIINGVLAHQFLKVLGFLNVSQAKKVNMSNVIRILGDAQRRVLSALLYEKFLAGAKWKTVEQATRIKNPYTLGRKDGVVDEFAQGVKDATTCPRCLEQSLPDLPNEEEVEEMIKEAEIRLLKSKMASYRRQFENGMLSSKGASILVAAANDAMNKGELSVDVNTLAASWELKGFYKKLKYIFVQLRKFTKCPNYSDEYVGYRWQEIFFNIATHQIFNLCIYFVVFINAVPIILQITRKPPRGFEEAKTYAFINTAFVVIYFTQIFIKMLAFGFIQFLHCHWNKVTALIKLISLADLSIDYVSNFVSPTDPTITLVAFVFLVLRFLHFQSPLRAAVSSFSMIINNYINRKLCQTFELQKCFINGEEEVLEMLKQMVYHQHVADQIKEKLEKNCSQMEQRMGKILRETPDVEITVYTRQVAVSTLKHLKEAIEKLKTRGMLDELEFENLNKVLEMKLSHITTHFEMIAMSDYPTLLRAIPWISGNEELAIAVEAQSEIKRFNCIEPILNPGPLNKFYVILLGSVKIQYKPSHRIINDLKQYGMVPRIDFFRNLDFSEQQEHTIPAGNVIGEMSLVTDGVYDATVSCVAPVEAYNAKTTLARLERAFILDLKLVERFRVTKLVKDVLLINGMARDELGGEIFTGPCYITRTVHKLEVHYSSSSDKADSVPSMLFVIPEEGISKEQIMQQSTSTSAKYQHFPHRTHQSH